MDSFFKTLDYTEIITIATKKIISISKIYDYLRLGSEDSDSEDGDGIEGDDVKDDIKTILSRVETVRTDILAKMFDYDEKKEHLNTLKRKHERQTQSLIAKQVFYCQGYDQGYET